MSNRSQWISFVTLRCESWHRDNVVLMGDAAHTAHFTIGSGTKLAMEDAVSLAASLQRHEEMEKALLEYEMDRQPVVDRFQEAARESATYFENVRRYAKFTPLQFTFNLLTRSGRITHLELEKRDAAFVGRVDAAFASGPAVDDSVVLVAPPPAFAPLQLRGVNVTNRVTLTPGSRDDASQGLPGEEFAERLVAASRTGVGTILAEFVAVSPDGRITPGTPGLYADEHVEAWTRIVDRIHAESGATIAVHLGHAGSRGATRPRRFGIDRPLGEGGWPLVAASAVPYTKRSPVPRELPTDEMPDVLESFVSSARRASFAGFDVLMLDMAHGQLLASFLSPLTNRRADEYGGSPENRARFPLEVFEAVRDAWPSGRPIGALLLASDWVRGGFDADDAVDVARSLKERGCDLIQPVAGQTVVHDDPAYGRFFLVPFADRIRNEAGVPTLVGGNITTNDEMNTILAAGRADLCLLDPRLHSVAF